MNRSTPALLHRDAVAHDDSVLATAMPQWDRRERHRLRTGATPEWLLEAVEGLTWGEVPIFRALMGLRFGGWRRVPSDARVFTWFESEGFRRVGRTSDELVVVAVHRTRRTDPARVAAAVASLDAFRGHDDPGSVKLCLNFRCSNGHLTTETRVRATDTWSRRLLTVYWLAIRPGSGLIRHVWLRAVRARAERKVEG